MEILSLYVANYKNLSEVNLSLCSGFNFFIGKNGAGKTNVLDALYHLSMCKSMTRLPDSQNIKHGQDYFLLQTRYHRDEETHELSCGVKRGEHQRLIRDGKAYDRLSDHIGEIPLVVVSPQDSELIEGGSEERRRIIDVVLSLSDHTYLQQLMLYNRLLSQRNDLLRTSSVHGVVDTDLLTVLDEQLSASGEILLAKRLPLVERLSASFCADYDTLSMGSERVRLTYRASAPSGELLAALTDNRQRDLYLGYSTVGVHRDDLSMEIDGYAVKRVGSQGQRKCFLVALKMAQYNFLHETLGCKPLLLLDDLFDKLDAERAGRILEMVASDRFGQVFVTDTDRAMVDAMSRSYEKPCRSFNVISGNVAQL